MFQKWTVFVFAESWSHDQLMQKAYWYKRNSSLFDSPQTCCIYLATGHQSEIDFLKVVCMVFWSGVVGPSTNFRSLVLPARRSYDHASRSLSRYALKRSTSEQVYKVRFPCFQRKFIACNNIILSYNTSMATYVCCHFWCFYPWNKWWRLVLSVYIGQLKFKCCIQGAKLLLPSFFLFQ